ncbi:MAG TPA: plasmid replication protein, CyRepA1 family [Noviherbaspirillum sp.]|nr:plasmid replication protein, CyRepA1 family [Noviherbaspirillum sp.]
MSLSPFEQYLKTNKKARQYEDYPQLVYRRTSSKNKVTEAIEFDSSYERGIEFVSANSRYLEGDVPVTDERLRDANLVFVKSDKGTGKTQWLRKYLKSIPEYRSVLVLTHRRSLARTLSNALEVQCYLDEPELHWRYTLSLDSLERANNIRGYDVIVIDESEQVFRHLIGDTTKDRREAIFNTLLKLIHFAKQIVCCDADLTSELTCHLMSKLRRNFEQEDRVLSIVNEWKTNRPINVFESKYHALAKFICDVEDGKRVYVPVGEKELAIEIQALMKYVRRPYNEPVAVLLLTGDTSSEEAAQTFFSDPTGESQKYDVLIATSTLSTGVSINGTWFDAVYGLFDGSVYTYQDCDQAISRVRNCPSVNVWIHRGRALEYTSEKAMWSGPEQKELQTRRLCMPGERNELSEAEKLYLDVHTRIGWCEQNWKMDRCHKFIELKKDSGWEVQWWPENKAWKAAGKEMLRIAKDPTGTRKYKPIIEADNLELHEYELLKDDRNLRAKQRRAVIKYRIAELFGLSSPALVTLDHVMKYHEDDVRGIVRNIKLLSEKEEYARYLDRIQRENPDGKTFTLFDHRTMKHQLLSGAMDASGINPKDVLRDAKRYAELKAELEQARRQHKSRSRKDRKSTAKFKSEFEKLKRVVDDDQLRRVAEYVSENLNMVNMFLGTRFQKPEIPENRKKVFNAVLGKFGVVIKLDRRMVNSECHSCFIIDYGRVMELAATRSDLWLEEAAT